MSQLLPLALDSPRWQTLQHAYGPAHDIPPLLRQLAGLPDDKDDAEPWFTLWSALAHQGDVYTASFAAVPHVVNALATSPVDAHATYFHFPAWVEACRQRNRVTIPDDLAGAYQASLTRLPQLVAEAAARPWDASYLQCALAAIAAAKGAGSVIEAVLELSPDVATDFMAWLDER